MTVEEFYKKIDANYQDVVRRLISKDIVERIVVKFKDDSTFNNFQEAMQQKNYKEAFRFIHTLKGTSANLGFDKLYKSSHILTESLRNQTYDDIEKQYQKVIDDYQEIMTYLKQVK